MPLTWSAAIATYKREHVLHRALLLAAGSTCSPKQIIVIDASPNWESIREKTMREIATKYPNIEWIYERAPVASLTRQRNQGVQLVSSDLIMFIDDDTLMYPDCAQEILRVFEKDSGNKVVAVGAVSVPKAPDDDGVPETFASRGDVPTDSNLKIKLRAMIEGDFPYLLPYDGDWPTRPIPPELTGLPISRANTLNGWLMCVRRPIVIREPFEEILYRYAYLEDSDMTYRASRHGLVLRCLSAKVCHLKAYGGRLPPYVVSLLGALNPVVLHGIYSTDKARSKEQLRRQMRRRMMFLALKDLEAGRLTLPSARGVCEAMNNLDAAMNKPAPELREWYPQFQKSLVERFQSD
jgi:GT2 family glycosyltransferase